jgi:hypothetical protein
LEAAIEVNQSGAFLKITKNAAEANDRQQRLHFFLQWL